MARIWAPAMMACVSDLLPSPGRRMNLVGRISRETPNTLPVAIGASRTMASAAGSSLLHIRWHGPSNRMRGQGGLFSPAFGRLGR